MADWASEAGHWYDSVTGEPRYTIIGKNGVERPTTLRDARPNGWYPGTTTITGCAHKFSLEDWKQKQAILAALTTSRQPNETDEQLVERIHTDSKEQAKKAAERGTEIHAALEVYFAGRAYPDALMPWVKSVARLLHQTFGEQNWRTEKSFASPLGYGGKVDLHSDSVLVDFKGKEAKKGVRDWNTYDEHAMQLAAYIMGVHGAEGWLKTDWSNITAAIVFFDRNEPYSEAHIVKPADLARGWEMFKYLLGYWRATNRYAP